MDKQKWQKLSWGQQLGNIASELSRFRHWEAKDDSQMCRQALTRALALVDLTLESQHRASRLKELTRFREVLSDWYVGAKTYDVPPQLLENFCLQIALLDSRQMGTDPIDIV